jgi:URI fold toxin 2
MNFHGNSNQNNKIHHLYVLDDAEENDIFKYGISDKPIDADNYSLRMREQVDYLNRAVGWFRFSGEVLIRNIDGRPKARIIEDAYINAYKKKHGRNPRGNVD